MLSILESLEPRRLFAGVTILSHGYNGNINGWISNAADDVIARIGGVSQASEYVMTVVSHDGELAIDSFELESGFLPFDQTAQSEIIVKLDWSTVSSGPFSTADVAGVVADYMTTLHASLPRLAELPIHHIGHSRGASLGVALAQELGKAGIWVEQLTHLDPHPIDGDGDFLNADYGDIQMTGTDNVIFADNYWRTDGNAFNFDFDGEATKGAHNLRLNSVQSNFIGSAHGSVPGYYIGTIDHATADGGDTPINSNWYGNSAIVPARDETGFEYSRLIGGVRPSEGLSIGFGGGGQREPAGEVGEQWGNVGSIRILGGREFEIGQTIKLRLIRQDRDSKANINLLLDRDRNPFNNNFVRTLVRKNVAEADNITVNRWNGSTHGAGAGTYYVCARISDAAGHVRYAYSRYIELTRTASAPGGLRFSPMRMGARANLLPDELR